MKSKIILIAIVVGAGLLFLSAGTLLTNRNSDGLADKRTNLALRSIGHQLMLQAGNSRSRVLPVKQIDPFTYQLEFRSAFSFTPDSLVKIVQQKLKEVDSSSHYFVMVLSCNDPTEIIYGYEFSAKKNITVPCLGREQRVGCYMIQIVFPDKKENKSSANYIWMVTLSMMALIGFVGGRYIQKEKKIPSIVPEEFLTVGKYKFYHQRRVLKYHDESVELSDKEAQVLKILATQVNELVERDRLLKEVWEDDGVFVGRSLDVFISKLRKKLQHDSSLRIVSVHGKGYKLEV